MFDFFAYLCDGKNSVGFLLCFRFLSCYTSFAQTGSKIIYSYNSQVFATPETLIGFHPDAGTSFFLSHLSGHLGMPLVHCSFSHVVKIFTEFLVHGFVDLDYFWFLHKSDKNIM